MLPIRSAHVSPGAEADHLATSHVAQQQSAAASAARDAANSPDMPNVKVVLASASRRATPTATRVEPRP
jgi:hypothetical protein